MLFELIVTLTALQTSLMILFLTKRGFIRYKKVKVTKRRNQFKLINGNKVVKRNGEK